MSSRRPPQRSPLSAKRRSRLRQILPHQCPPLGVHLCHGKSLSTSMLFFALFSQQLLPTTSHRRRQRLLAAPAASCVPILPVPHSTCPSARRSVYPCWSNNMAIRPVPGRAIGGCASGCRPSLPRHRGPKGVLPRRDSSGRVRIRAVSASIRRGRRLMRPSRRARP